MPQRNRKTKTRDGASRSLRWSTVNYALMGSGILSLSIGYVLLAGGSTVAAPLLLALGYVVLIPLGIVR